MLQVQQTAFKSPFSQKVALAGLDRIDVPSIGWRIAAHGVLEATSPVRTVHAIFIHHEYLESLIGIVFSCDFSREDGDVIGILRQGETCIGLDEHVTVGQSRRRDAQQPDRPIRTHAKRCGRGAGGYCVGSSAYGMKGQGLFQGTRVHQGQGGAGVGSEVVETGYGIRIQLIGFDEASGIAIWPASRCRGRLGKADRDERQ